ncbi:MAG: hypothetical protein K0Q89_1784, partial [Thermomicrobiales bacterium]|nr:hypothetical protein [Thermomicrobiales bacterium]
MRSLHPCKGPCKVRAKGWIALALALRLLHMDDEKCQITLVSVPRWAQAKAKKRKVDIVGRDPATDSHENYAGADLERKARALAREFNLDPARVQAVFARMID